MKDLKYYFCLKLLVNNEYLNIPILLFGAKKV